MQERTGPAFDRPSCAAPPPPTPTLLEAFNNDLFKLTEEFDVLWRRLRTVNDSVFGSMPTPAKNDCVKSDICTVETAERKLGRRIEAIRDCVHDLAEQVHRAEQIA
jgi:hypothetical protein